jgi:hypothetical protein
MLHPDKVLMGSTSKAPAAAKRAARQLGGDGVAKPVLADAPDALRSTWRAGGAQAVRMPVSRPGTQAPHQPAKRTVNAPGLQALLAIVVLGFGAFALLTVLFQPEGRCTVVPALQIGSSGPRC